MQQAARRRAAGERLAIRVGLHVGEALREESDYFGTAGRDRPPALRSRRTPGRSSAARWSRVCWRTSKPSPFVNATRSTLKGVAAPVAACEVSYQHGSADGAVDAHALRRACATELARLATKLQRDAGGQRRPRDARRRARDRQDAHARGVRGDGPHRWGAGALGPLLRRRSGATVRAVRRGARGLRPRTLPPRRSGTDLGFGAAPLARLVPRAARALPDMPEPVALQPDEERARLLDAMAQWLIALAERAPVVLVLDDLHWADAATVALTAPRGTLRGAPPIARCSAPIATSTSPTQQPLADALGALPRETTYEHVALGGLTSEEVEKLLEAVDEKVVGTLATAITTETSGNPFFIREVLLHLVEEGKMVWRESAWTSPLSVERVGIPQGVRQVIQRRLARLPERAQRLRTPRRAAREASASRWWPASPSWRRAEALDAIDDALGGTAAARGRGHPQLRLHARPGPPCALRRAEPAAPDAAPPSDRRSDGGSVRRSSRRACRRDCAAVLSQQRPTWC